MRLAAIFAIAAAFASGARADCGWTLQVNDCICMKSTDGTLMTAETATCCRDMGLKTTVSVRFSLEMPYSSSPNLVPEMQRGGFRWPADV